MKPKTISEDGLPNQGEVVQAFYSSDKVWRYTSINSLFFAQDERITHWLPKPSNPEPETFVSAKYSEAVAVLKIISGIKAVSSFEKKLKKALDDMEKQS